jgi:hypothetical protein
MSEEKAIQKDAVFDASIEFIKTLTGMEPPPIEIAPPEVLKPFREFTEKVCSIFHNSPPQRIWVGLTDEHKEGLIYMTDPNPEPHHLRELIDVVEYELRSKNT